MQLALRQEYKARHLPAMELMHFNGNPVLWREFIYNFYQNVHSFKNDIFGQYKNDKIN